MWPCLSIVSWWDSATCLTAILSLSSPTLLICFLANLSAIDQMVRISGIIVFSWVLWKLTAEQRRETQVCASAEGAAGRLSHCMSYLTSAACSNSASMTQGLPQCQHILSTLLGRRRLDSGFLGNQHLLFLLLEQHINLAVADGAGSSILSCGVWYTLLIIVF